MSNLKKLNRAEMKKVKGGQPVPIQCSVGSLCQNVVVGHTDFGTCDANCNCSAGGPPCTTA
jgi:hypothetical protein